MCYIEKMRELQKDCIYKSYNCLFISVIYEHTVHVYYLILLSWWSNISSFQCCLCWLNKAVHSVILFITETHKLTALHLTIKLIVHHCKLERHGTWCFNGATADTIVTATRGSKFWIVVYTCAHWSTINMLSCPHC